MATQLTTPMYYDCETNRWKFDFLSIQAPPCPGAPKKGYTQYFDRDTWDWVFVKN